MVKVHRCIFAVDSWGRLNIHIYFLLYANSKITLSIIIHLHKGFAWLLNSFYFDRWSGNFVVLTNQECYYWFRFLLSLTRSKDRNKKNLNATNSLYMRIICSAVEMLISWFLMQNLCYVKHLGWIESVLTMCITLLHTNGPGQCLLVKVIRTTRRNPVGAVTMIQRSWIISTIFSLVAYLTGQC